VSANPSDTILASNRSTLKGFTDSPLNGIDLRTAPPRLEVRVDTKNTSYRLIASGQGQVYIEGGSYFPHPTAARVEGASADGRMVRSGWIVVGLCMEVTASGQRIVTSPVRSILSTLRGESHQP
jgi:hypothetical protein